MIPRSSATIGPSAGADTRESAGLDVVGFGYADAPKDFQYNLHTWTGHLCGLLDALGIPRVSVLGNSLGGALALKMAIDRPERIVTMGVLGVKPQLRGISRKG